MGKFKRVPPEVPVSDLTPLDITCTSTKCEDGYHCFKSSIKAAKKFGHEGCCRECGSELIEWDRVHKNDINDAAFIFASMKNELIRHVFWHTKIEEEVIAKAVAKGRTELKKHSKKHLRSKIGGEQNAWDGRQTPMTSNDIVTYAQHATATCCRKCLEYWHNIPVNRKLTEEQLEFCSELIMLYIEEHVPGLEDENDDQTKVEEDGKH